MEADKQTISVATLNFSGINNNPFEFDDGSDIFNKLNTNFQLIKAAEFPEKKAWEGALLDKNFKKDRFTILFGNELTTAIKGKNLPSKA